MTQNQKQLVVMQILPSLQSGGVERGTIDIAKALKKEGIDALLLNGDTIDCHKLSRYVKDPKKRNFKICSILRRASRLEVQVRLQG